MEGVKAPVVDRDAEQMQADDADIAVADVDGTGMEDDVAAMFMDDGDGMGFGEDAQDKMVMALTTAGVTVEKAKINASSICKRVPNNHVHCGLWPLNQISIIADASQPQCRSPQCP